VKIQQHAALGLLGRAKEKVPGRRIVANFEAVGFQKGSRGIPNRLIIVHHMDEG
jgi:hypothetical protein